jgi:hypothetical protein
MPARMAGAAALGTAVRPGLPTPVRYDAIAVYALTIAAANAKRQIGKRINRGATLRCKRLHRMHKAPIGILRPN